MVSIVSPSNGSTVSKTTNIVVSARDESGVSRVEFYIDGKLVARDATEPYSYRWNTRSVRDGWHMITIKAYDIYGNKAEVTIKVYVANRYIINSKRANSKYSKWIPGFKMSTTAKCLVFISWQLSLLRRCHSLSSKASKPYKNKRW
ncbi:MAG: Ig-like domain-containing protein [Candidatus Bathyarchaeia archaeon]